LPGEISLIQYQVKVLEAISGKSTTYIKNDKHTSSKCIKVEPGDITEGFIHLESVSNGEFNYSFGFSGEKFKLSFYM
jgi:hypothetical protein